MAVEVLDAAVEVAKDQEKKKLFKDTVTGESNKPLEDISMEGTVNNMPRSDQPAIEADTKSKDDKKLCNGCLDKMVENSRYEVNLPLLGDYIQYMKDHTVIGKFMGIWPSKKALTVWIKSRWKFKGDISLKLGSKGLFALIFTCFEDGNKVFDEGLYFFDSIGLHLRHWSEYFSPKKEDFTIAPVWIKLYSLAQELWHLETLEQIGNTLGSFVKISKITKATKYTSYTRICVYRNVAGALPESITISFQDKQWVQTIYCEHISFRCRKCHEHGHLFRDFP
jgi:hypothetical protein